MKFLFKLNITEIYENESILNSRQIEDSFEMQFLETKNKRKSFSSTLETELKSK